MRDVASVPPTHVVVGPRGDLPALMDEGRELAVAVGAQPDAVARLGAVGRDGEALVAGGDAACTGRLSRCAASATSAVRGVSEPLRAEGAADDRG